MELRHLRVFVAVADERHFGRAAQRLHLTQPSISGHIRQLETELGARLLNRTARQVALTEAGVAFLGDARRIVSQTDAAAVNLRSWRSGTLSRLRVGYIADALPRALPTALRRMAVTRGAPRVQISSGPPHDLIAQVREESLDVAIVSLPAPLGGLRTIPFARETATVAISTAILGREEPEVPLEIVAQGILLTPPRRANPGFFDAVVSAFRTAGVSSPLLEVESASVEELVMQVTSGAGMALVPGSASDRYRAHGIAFRVLAHDAPVGCDLAIITRDRRLDPHVAMLHDALTRPLATLPTNLSEPAAA